MSIVKDYLTKKIIYDNHPVPETGRCLNSRQSRRLCTVCREVCPEGVFEKVPGEDREQGGQIWDLCSGCGLCAGACPARAIRMPRLQIEALYALAARNYRDVALRYDHIIISCINEQKADYFTEYPGALPWELLCCFALSGGITILTGNCADCKKSTCRESLQKALEQARQFLSGSSYGGRIHVTENLMSENSRQYTRREAIAHLVRRTGRTAVSLLPLPEDTGSDSIFWRQLLVTRIKALGDNPGTADPREDTGKAVLQEGRGKAALQEDPEKAVLQKDRGKTVLRDAPKDCSAFYWTVPGFTHKCTACGICTKLCPAGALLRAPGPEGSGHFYLALIPWKCTGCGLCAGVCPEKALLPTAPVPLKDPAKPVLHRVDATPCSRCGEPVPSGGGSDLCPRCRAELRI